MSTHTATINVLRTLCLLGQKAGRLNVSEVIDTLGVSRATAYRYLSYLEAFGLASRLGKGDFILGPEIPLLEKAARTGDVLLAAALPVLETLSKNTGATTVLERVSGERRTVVAIQNGTEGPVLLAERPGSEDPIGVRGRRVRIIDHPTALRIHSQLKEMYVSDGTGESRTRADDSDESELVCIVEGQQIEATVSAWSVMLRGRVVCRLLALTHPGTPVFSEHTSLKAQVRRAALRIEGRLEVELPVGK